MKPWGVALINISGSFLIGAATTAPGLSPTTRLALATGFCGGFTTFSTYSVDVIALGSAGKVAEAAAYVTVNNAGSILAAWLGMWIFRRPA